MSSIKCTKKQLMDAFLLYLDDSLPTFNCKKIEKDGNWDCDRCDFCMMNQYLKRVKNGDLPRIAKENNGEKLSKNILILF